MNSAGSLKDLQDFGEGLRSTGERMPLMFVGHGSPMNAIEDNEFSAGWADAAKELRPSAVLCVSAHWETHGTFVTAMERPRTIHDFYGFPPELYNVEYPAPGSPALAEHTKETVRKAIVGLDRTWGLDHGCWSVARRMFPGADVPVLQLSLDHDRPPEWHYALAADLAGLRTKGVLILGSGNMVHNLSMLNWENPDVKYEWAEEMNEKLRQLILDGNHTPLINYPSLGEAAMLSIPTNEHYLPMLYVLGLREKGEEVRLFNDRTVMGSVSMTSFRVG
jgi:4,5-DOPA dioxygenase extradiol